MKIRFNKFEKVAGLFVLIAILACVGGMIGITIKNGWFASKVKYYTYLESADGVHPGTDVQIAGLRVGSVTAVELQEAHRVAVRFEVLEKFKNRVRVDSTVQMYRPFILGEKVLEVSMGSGAANELEPESEIATVSSTDIMDLLSGKKMGAMISSFDNLAESIRIVGTAFADPKRTKALVEMFDRLNPLVASLGKLSTEVTKMATTANKERRLETIVSNLAAISSEMEKVMPAFAKEVPDLGTELGQIVRNLNILAAEFQKLTPAISAIAPDLPRTSLRAVEALDETVVLLKAMQKSFFLRGNVKDVRKEEEEREPASHKGP